MPEFVLDGVDNEANCEVSKHYAKLDKPEGTYWVKVSATLFYELLKEQQCPQKKTSKTGKG